MKPILFTLVATVCYGVCNNLLELKFSKVNALTVMSLYAPVIWIVAVGLRQFVKTDADPSFNFPTGGLLILGVILGLIYSTGDYFFIRAYNHGGDVVTITCITVLVPVVASAIKFGSTKQLPNVWQVSGYFLAACAVVLVAKGSTTK